MNKLTILLLLCCAQLTHGQTIGRLDETFGVQGISAVHYRTMNAFSAVAVQPDGKIVAVGYTEKYNRTSAAVIRLLPNGELDPAFGTNGIFTHQINPISNVATDVTLLSNGKILVTGYYCAESNFPYPYPENIFVLGLTENGVLDAAFGTNGLTTVNLTRNDRAVKIRVGNGKVYVAANSVKDEKSDMFLIRFNMDGVLDAGFGTGGVVLLNNSPSVWTFCTDMDLQSDGKIVVSGESISALSSSNFTLMRLNEDGAFDNTFSGDGKVTNSLSVQADIPQAVEIQSDGKILAAGYSIDAAGHTNFAMVRYAATGNLDNDFGALGKVITQLPDGFGAISDVAVTPTGAIIAVGTAKNACGDFDWALTKYDQAGVLQTTFGEQGFLLTDFDRHQDGSSQASLLPDGKLIVVGTGINLSNSGTDFLAARYIVSGSVGTTDLASNLAEVRIFPNPISGHQCTFEYEISAPSDVLVELYSLTGQMVGVLANNAKEPGRHSETLNLPVGLAKGGYIAAIQTKTGRTFIKLMIQ